MTNLAAPPRRYARVVGVGGHLPERIVSNEDLQKTLALDISPEWIVSRTGIRSRYLAAPGELAGDLALPAARQAMARAGVAGKDLDLIVFATTTPDRIFPATACLLQARLGAAPCAAFDVQAVCSGFLYAMTIGETFISAGRAERALIVGAETYSHILDWEDRGTCVLFGDGAGAAVLAAADSPGIVRAKIYADGAHADKLTVNAHVNNGELIGDSFTRMDGGAVYRFAVEKMRDSAAEVLGDLRADWLVAHQANARIIEATRRRLGVAAERTILTVGEHGNTSAASIPLALSARSAEFQSGDNIVIAAVGGGFTWGAALVRW